MMKKYITVHQSHVMTQDVECAEDVLATVIAAGYRRSEIDNFNQMYTKSYASTAPQEKRCVYVRYAPKGTTANPVMSDDIILTLLAHGWEPTYGALLDSVMLCKTHEQHMKEDGQVAVNVTPVTSTY